MQPYRMIIFMLLLLLPNLSVGQDSVFAFVRYPGMDRFAPKPVTNYKYAVAKKVFDRLVQAKGNYKMPVPTLVMNTGVKHMAWMNPVTREIGIEERAYDVCRQFAADSIHVLAAMLAHELIHYYEKHDLQRHFAAARPGVQAESLEQSIIMETESDFLGGVLALSAGFDVFSQADSFLAIAYSAYDFPPDLEGYPNLAARQKNSTAIADSLAGMASVLDMGRWLTYLGEYQMAQIHYDYILNIYQGYELLSNAGVNAALAALELGNRELQRFAWPLEVDATNRLSALTSRNSGSEEILRRQWIQKADRWLQSAQLLAPEDATTYLNRACLYALQEAWFDAAYQAQKALFLSKSPRSIANAQIVQGILVALQGDSTKAESLFLQAQAGNPVLARLNLSQLHTPGKNKALVGMAPVGPPEQIGDLFLGDFMDNPRFQSLKTVTRGTYCGFQPLSDSDLLIHYEEDSQDYVLVQVTRPDYTGKTKKGIQLGATAEEIQNQYGPPPRSVSVAGGLMLIYPNHQLLFQLDLGGHLTRWAVFRISER